MIERPATPEVKEEPKPKPQVKKVEGQELKKKERDDGVVSSRDRVATAAAVADS